MSRKAVIGVAVAALAVPGCGGSSTLSQKALTTHAEELHSLAAEGSLVSRNAARGRSTVTFTEMHARYLRDAATVEADALAGAKPRPGLAAQARELAALARRVHAELDRLSSSGGDRAEQRRLAGELASAAKQAGELAP